MDQRTHVYSKPDMYIGGDNLQEMKEKIYHLQEGKIVDSKFTYGNGPLHLYKEILGNAGDNAARCRLANVDPKSIEVTMDSKTVTVKNYGLPIPVEIHPTYNLYVAQVILGDLLSGSNLETNGEGIIGTNGIGAKATNVYSTRFSVFIEDHERHLDYHQEWTNNMLNVTEPIIRKYTGKTSSVTISYDMDFARFKLEQYSPEIIGLYARYALDLSFTSKVPIVFNGIEFNYTLIRDYARLYYPEAAVESAVCYYQWKKDAVVIKASQGQEKSVGNPVLEFLVLDTPGSSYNLSFVNNVNVPDGGIHVLAALDAVATETVKEINAETIRYLTKSLGSTPTKDQLKGTKITMAHVKNHLSVVISYFPAGKPSLTGQTKSKLSAPAPDPIKIKPSELKKVKKWELKRRLESVLIAKDKEKTKKTDGKCTPNVNVKKAGAQDANFAGRKGRENTTLYITEGTSAAGYVYELVKYIPGGYDVVGILPMKGKCLNVSKVSGRSQREIDDKINNNEEIGTLKQMLGLKDDTDYTLPEHKKQLRYGSLMILTDADVDGKHITGLVLNLMKERFPSLLKIGFVKSYYTPIIRVTKGKMVKKFYTGTEFKKWEASGDTKGWQIEYFKGLGSSNKAIIAEDSKTNKIINHVYDDEAEDSLALAFKKENEDLRKVWISSWDNNKEIVLLKNQPISYFIKNELVEFATESNKRAIPRMLDGFKESQRKILFGFRSKNWGEPVKVSDAVGYISAETSYHHGPTSMEGAVISMAQDFVGSNNILLLKPDGNMGSRIAGGKDAANGRYTKTKPTKIVDYIFRKEDDGILEYLTDEGKSIEPLTYYPIIPMLLVNGANGMGTGWSTTIPKHNPKDIIAWLIARMDDSPLPEVFPWYDGFTGHTEIVDIKTKQKKINKGGKITVGKVEDNDIIDDEEEVTEKDTIRVNFCGSFTVTGNDVVVSELPVGLWYQQYNGLVNDWIENGTIKDKSIKEGDRIVYTLNGVSFPDNEKPNLKNLHLIKTISLTNLHALDRDNKVIKYASVLDILESFYTERLELYQVRKDYMIREMEYKILLLSWKIYYVQEVVEDRFIIFKRKNSDILNDMVSWGMDLDLAKTIREKTGNNSYTLEGIEKLQKELAELEKEKDTLILTDIKDLWKSDLKELLAVYKPINKVQGTVAKAKKVFKFVMEDE